MKHFHSIKDPRNDSAAPVQAAQSKETADVLAPETSETPAAPAAPKAISGGTKHKQACQEMTNT